MQQPGEPSVEEILDSIKKVIARDNRDSAVLDRRRKPAAPAASEPVEPADADEAEEVLELADEIALEEGARDADGADEDEADALPNLIRLGYQIVAQDAGMPGGGRE